MCDTMMKEFVTECLFYMNAVDVTELNRDVKQIIISLLLRLVNEVILSRDGIPADIVFFAYFPRRDVDMFEIVIPDKKVRKNVHEFCEEVGIYGTTKWVRRKEMLYRCPYCRTWREQSDANFSDGQVVSVYCDWCSDYEIRIFYPYEEGFKAKKSAESTGVMLIRRHQDMAYKKYAGPGGSYRKQTYRK